MMKLRQFFPGDPPRSADGLLIARQEKRPDQEEEKTEEQYRSNREHGDSQIGIADRCRTYRGKKPPDR